MIAMISFTRFTKMTKKTLEALTLVSHSSTLLDVHQHTKSSCLVVLSILSCWSQSDTAGSLLGPACPMQPGHFCQIHSSLRPFFLALTARLLQPFFFGSYSQALTAFFLALTARLLQPGSYSQALTAFFWLLQPGSYSLFFWLLQPGSYSQPLTGFCRFCIAVPAVPDIHPVRLQNTLTTLKPPLKLDHLS